MKVIHLNSGLDCLSQLTGCKRQTSSCDVTRYWDFQKYWGKIVTDKSTRSQEEYALIVDVNGARISRIGYETFKVMAKDLEHEYPPKGMSETRFNWVRRKIEGEATDDQKQKLRVMLASKECCGCNALRADWKDAELTMSCTTEQKVCALANKLMAQSSEVQLQVLKKIHKESPNIKLSIHGRDNA